MSIRFCKNCYSCRLISFGDVWACPRCGSVESDWEDSSSTVDSSNKTSSMGGTEKE